MTACVTWAAPRARQRAVQSVPREEDGLPIRPTAGPVEPARKTVACASSGTVSLDERERRTLDNLPDQVDSFLHDANVVLGNLVSGSKATLPIINKSLLG